MRDADRLSDSPSAQVVVAGLGVSGFAAADGLMSLGAKVIVLDESQAHADKATLLEALDVTVVLGPGATAQLPPGTDLVVTSPGWRPSAPLPRQAAAAGVPVWGETELAWRMMQPDRVIPWLGITGTNGKTTTTQMLESMLIADGRKAAAVGNIGRPIVEAILDDVRQEAVDKAIAAGASPATVKIVDFYEVPIPYLPGNATRVRAKAVGDLDMGV